MQVSRPGSAEISFASSRRAVAAGQESRAERDFSPELKLTLGTDPITSTDDWLTKLAEFPPLSPSRIPSGSAVPFLPPKRLAY